MPEVGTAWRVDDGSVEEIARVYRAAARGDAHAALTAVIRDGLSELDREDRRLTEAIRLASRGYARGRLAG